MVGSLSGEPDLYITVALEDPVKNKNPYYDHCIYFCSLYI